MQRQSFLASNVYAGQHPKPQHWVPTVPTPKGNPHYIGSSDRDYYTRLESESFEPLIDFLEFLVQKL